MVYRLHWCGDLQVYHASTKTVSLPNPNDHSEHDCRRVGRQAGRSMGCCCYPRCWSLELGVGPHSVFRFVVPCGSIALPFARYCRFLPHKRPGGDDFGSLVLAVCDRIGNGFPKGTPTPEQRRSEVHQLRRMLSCLLFLRCVCH